jgi:hypothetical protein
VGGVTRKLEVSGQARLLTTSSSSPYKSNAAVLAGSRTTTDEGAAGGAFCRTRVTAVFLSAPVTTAFRPGQPSSLHSEWESFVKTKVSVYWLLAE